MGEGAVINILFIHILKSCIFSHSGGSGGGPDNEWEGLTQHESVAQNGVGADLKLL